MITSLRWGLIISILVCGCLLLQAGCVKMWEITFANRSGRDVTLFCAQWLDYRHSLPVDQASLSKESGSAALRFNDAGTLELEDLEVRWVAVSGQEVVDFGGFCLDNMDAQSTIEIKDNRELARALHVTAIPVETKPESSK